MKFKSSYLRNELGLPYEGVIENKVIEVTRWSIVHEIVFEHEGKFYQTEYSVGATENQPEGPWDYQDDVECDEVELKEVVVMKWVLKKEGN